MTLWDCPASMSKSIPSRPADAQRPMNVVMPESEPHVKLPAAPPVETTYLTPACVSRETFAAAIASPATPPQLSLPHSPVANARVIAFPPLAVRSLARARGPGHVRRDDVRVPVHVDARVLVGAEDEPCGLVRRRPVRLPRRTGVRAGRRLGTRIVACRDCIARPGRGAAVLPSVARCRDRRTASDPPARVGVVAAAPAVATDEDERRESEHRVMPHEPPRRSSRSRGSGRLTPQ